MNSLQEVISTCTREVLLRVKPGSDHPWLCPEVIQLSKRKRRLLSELRYRPRDTTLRQKAADNIGATEEIEKTKLF